MPLFWKVRNIAGGGGVNKGMGMSRLRTLRKQHERQRRGAASLDYVLILGVVLPLVVFIMKVGPEIMRLTYQMTCTLISWPFM
jgi:hypothetical protein